MHMTIHEYGKEKEKVVILIHPSLVMWDYFENVIPLMEGGISSGKAGKRHKIRKQLNIYKVDPK